MSLTDWAIVGVFILTMAVGTVTAIVFAYWWRSRD